MLTVYQHASPGHVLDLYNYGFDCKISWSGTVATCLQQQLLFIPLNSNPSLFKDKQWRVFSTLSANYGALTQNIKFCFIPSIVSQYLIFCCLYQLPTLAIVWYLFPFFTNLPLTSISRYFEGGVSSVYLWDLDHGFAGVVLIKKGIFTHTLYLLYTLIFPVYVLATTLCNYLKLFPYSWWWVKEN